MESRFFITATSAIVAISLILLSLALWGAQAIHSISLDAQFLLAVAGYVVFAFGLVAILITVVAGIVETTAAFRSPRPPVAGPPLPKPLPGAPPDSTR